MVWIKICGVTTPADAAFAAECGADAVGLNFYAKSRRYVTEGQAADIVRALSPAVAAVGVFVDTPADEVGRLAARFGLWAAQTYGEPPPVPARATGHIAAFRVEGEQALTRIREFVNASPVASRPVAILLDAFVPGEMGGTGHKAPWDLLAGFDPGVPVILAGGLTPDNVAEAIRTVRPWGVDVASGVESAPGKKDPGKVRAFVQVAREAAAGLSPPAALFRLRGGTEDLE
jgi:phosphoribosylanthranilate isomerase